MNIFRTILTAAAMALTFTSCSIDGVGQRPDSRPQGPDDDKLTFRINPDWTLSHSQDVIEDDNGFLADIDIITVKSVDQETYWLDVVTEENLEAWYKGDIYEYIKDEPNFYTGETYKGTMDITFDRMRSGKWVAVAFGADDKGNLTGDYAVLRFTIQEDEPSEDFLNWLGDWTITGTCKTDQSKDITYNIKVSSADANFLFNVAGWESGNGTEQDMSDYSIEVQYDRFTRQMLFKSLFIDTETLGGKQYDLCFYGNFIYDGSMGFTDMKAGEEQTVCDNIIIAESSELSSDARSATVKGLIFNFLHENKTYTTALTSMQYFDFPHDENDNGIYVKNQKIPVFPLTMTKAGSAEKVNSMSADASGRKTLKIKTGNHIRRNGTKAVTTVRSASSANAKKTLTR